MIIFLLMVNVVMDHEQEIIKKPAMVLLKWHESRSLIVEG